MMLSVIFLERDWRLLDNVILFLTSTSVSKRDPICREIFARVYGRL